MSQDKKVPGPKQAQARPGGEKAARDGDPNNADRDKNEMSDGNQADNRSRARNRDVLPGILGKQLKAAYSELLNAPVPDAITQLIKQLENKEPTPPQAKKPREESGQ
jgi:anti-sigma factor NepR-like protein